MLKTLQDLDLQDKKVLLRCDFNVPLKDGVIQDDTRIREAIPTIQELVNKGSSVILMSHLGRPNGNKVPEMSLKPVAERLSSLIGKEVKFVSEAIGDEPKGITAKLNPGELLLLENLRYYTGEKENDKVFAESLAELGDIFVQDAFGTVHRSHASMVGIAGILPSAAGRLLEKEIKYLSLGLNPRKPFTVILGGAKLETKIPIIENMLDIADTILVGGGMAYTFLKVKGAKIGKSLFDKESLSIAETILNKARDKSVDLQLPVDHVTTDDLENNLREIKKTGGIDISDGFIGVDIGDKTLENFKKKIIKSRTIVLNGPMGVFEISDFTEGTRRVLESVIEATKNGASSIVGGGDTVSAIKNLDFNNSDFTHISTGGGASLKFLEGKELPGIKVLEK